MSATNDALGQIGNEIVIKRIELVNFMSHARTVIEPAAGLTVLVGPNNCGKSAVVRALQILCQNPTKSAFVLRHGEQRCDIIVETDFGDVVQWTRKKSGAASYQVNGQVYDRLRGSVPDEVHRVLRMPLVDCDTDQFDIHFGEQSSPVFLLGDKGKAAAQFFASSSDASHLVAMQNLHKSKVTMAKRDLNRFSEAHDHKQSQLETLQPVAEIEQRLQACEQLQWSIESTGLKIDQLEDKVLKLNQLDRLLQTLDQRLVALRHVEAPPSLPDPAPLALTINNLARCEKIEQRSQLQSSVLQQLHSPPVFQPDQSLANAIGDLQRLATVTHAYTKNSEVLSELDAPPELQTTGKLNALTRELMERESKLAILERQCGSVTDLVQPPTIEDDHALHTLLRSIQQAEATRAAKESELARVGQALESTRDQLAEWLDDHPVCPTCGGTMDASKILGEGGDDES